MPVAHHIRSAAQWRRLGLAAVALIALVGASIAGAQEPPQYRFFGFAGDVTIDGQPIPPGVVIAATIDGVEVARAEVNAAGAWVLGIASADFDADSCNLIFEVDGLQAMHSADDCSSRVRLALSSDDADLGEDLGGADDVDSAVAAEESSPSSEDELNQASSFVRPAPPRTGGGGLVESQSSAVWPRAAALTALLTLAVAVAALLLSRRSDGVA